MGLELVGLCFPHYVSQREEWTPAPSPKHARPLRKVYTGDLTPLQVAHKRLNHEAVQVGDAVDTILRKEYGKTWLRRFDNLRRVVVQFTDDEALADKCVEQVTAITCPPDIISMASEYTSKLPESFKKGEQ